MPLLHESVRKGAGITAGEVAEVVQELNQVIQGEVRMDTTSRMLYSTDASLYQMQPVCAVHDECLRSSAKQDQMT